MLKKALIFFTILGLLTACGGNKDEAGKETQNAADKVQAKKMANRGDFTTAEELEEMDFDSKDFKWEDIYLSEQTFNDILYRFTEPNDQGDVLLKRAELVEWDTVELVINNSEGDSLENSLQAVFLDSIVRQLYKHSELYNGEEPHIRTMDLNRVVLAENKEPINFGQGKKKGKGKE
ncbi:hypothetical protein AB685_17405 [Bacillus sp. LL01]|uniref:hypothetical protein n=1 Tax=Bacillus sp. LL01 TaxID=1665556 RepID=UPI00064CF603|nr:hypothetical protein [Bacillus sp. LL01]KMJ57186.1 hypothetical protein AB685_17405 [Bacillus sp. LL01]